MFKIIFGQVFASENPTNKLSHTILFHAIQSSLSSNRCLKSTL